MYSQREIVLDVNGEATHQRNNGTIPNGVNGTHNATNGNHVLTNGTTYSTHNTTLAKSTHDIYLVEDELHRTQNHTTPVRENNQRNNHEHLSSRNTSHANKKKASKKKPKYPSDEPINAYENRGFTAEFVGYGGGGQIETTDI